MTYSEQMMRLLSTRSLAAERQAMTDLGESKAVPSQYQEAYDNCCRYKPHTCGYCNALKDMLKLEATTREQAQTIERLTRALEHIKQHQEIVAGNMGGHTSAWNIANTALNYREKI